MAKKQTGPLGIYKCEHYPKLVVIVPGGAVTFKDGELTTDKPEVAEILDRTPEVECVQALAKEAE